MGDLYNEGIRGPREPFEAVTWWTRAAEKNDPEAQLRLAQAYARGRGAQRDYAQAYIWASIAAIQGNAIALELRNKVMARLRPAEIERADTEVNTWLAPRMASGHGGSS
jgi:TPR repeat protein